MTALHWSGTISVRPFKLKPKAGLFLPWLNLGLSHCCHDRLNINQVGRTSHKYDVSHVALKDSLFSRVGEWLPRSLRGRQCSVSKLKLPHWNAAVKAARLLKHKQYRILYPLNSCEAKICFFLILEQWQLPLERRLMDKSLLIKKARLSELGDHYQSLGKARNQRKNFVTDVTLQSIWGPDGRWSTLCFVGIGS